MAAGFHRANGDQPGLGKSRQAGRAADLVGAKTVLVTCPASVRTHWPEEFEKVNYHPRRLDVVSYNFCTAKANRAQLLEKYDVWIGDEFHMCKTCDSQRTRALLGSKRRDGFDGLARRATYKWPMSGTFAPNGRPVELFPMLKNFHPHFADMSFNTYAQRYCGAFWDGRELNVKGATQIEELAELLRSYVVRRTKRQVFPDRVEPILSRVAVDLLPGDLEAVRAAEDEIGGREARLSSSYEKMSAMGDSSRLLRLLGIAMAPRVAEFVEDKLTGVDKVVIFFKHTDVGRALAERLDGHGVVVYEGGMTDRQKDEAKARFAQEKCSVFLGQWQAAGTGVDGLQRTASTMVLAEPGWTPGETEQWVDRLDRMGQEDEIVNAYAMHARGTLSAIVAKVHDLKADRGAALWGAA